MFHKQFVFDTLTPAGEPNAEARFREELDQQAPDSSAADQHLPREDNNLVLARHMVSAGMHIRFV